MTTAASARPFLRLVEPAEFERSCFCTHCGVHAPAEELNSRVCPDCAAGLLLETDRESLPRPDDAFLVVDSSLTVQAVSETAETLLDIREQHAVNRHITELLIPGDSEVEAGASLAGAIAGAAAGDRLPARVAVRPSNTFGVRMLARIAPCGPPRAALLVLESPVRR
jgi:hypothetical protein